MAFEAVLSFPENQPPIRAYVHIAGFRDIYGSELSAAKGHLQDVLSSYNQSIKTFDYILTAVWGNPQAKK